jgi:hypothetical protein
MSVMAFWRWGPRKGTRRDAAPLDPLKAAIARVEQAVLTLARARVPTATVFSIGAVEIDPKYLAVWIRTDTDAQRDALRADPGFQESLRAAVRQAGYPEPAVDRVGFAVQSDETVRRDYEGNWWYAIK